MGACIRRWLFPLTLSLCSIDIAAYLNLLYQAPTMGDDLEKAASTKIIDPEPIAITVPDGEGQTMILAGLGSFTLSISRTRK